MDFRLHIADFRFNVIHRFVSAAIVCILLACTAHAQEGDVVNLSADNTRWYSDDKVVATGNVKASYRDYTITAESVEADLQTNIAVFKGKVKLATKQQVVDGENLTLNLKTKEWSLENASSQIEPSVFQGQTTGRAFIHTTALSGDEKNLKLTAGTLTTCDLEHPHYYFSAKELDIYPESKIIARKVSMFGLDKRLFSLNALVIPIRGFRHNLMPQIGSSAEEGMFLKTAYAYTAKENAQGFLKLDLMQRRGIGTGIEHYYQMPSGSGQVSLYYLRDKEIGGNNITGRIEHNQRLGAVDVNLVSSYRTNNYLYYPSTTSQDWQVALAHATPKGNTALTFSNDSVRGYGTTKSSVSSLRHTQQFSKNLSGFFSMDMRKYSATGMEADDRELESSLELRQREDKYDLSLVMSKRIDLDDDEYTGDDFYSNLDRLPELTLDTDSYRMGKNFLGLPSRLSLSYGKYREWPSDVSKNRFLLQWDVLGQTVELGNRSDLNLTAGIRQAYYTSDEAQYVTKFGSVLTTRYNDYLKTRFTYNYQRPEGFSPFRFDYMGKYNYLRAVMDYQKEKQLRWSLSTGYDFNRDQNNWQDLSLRLTAMPNSNYGFSISTGYDLNRSKWRSLISRMQVSVPEKIDFELGSRYDIEKGRLNLARGRVDLHIGKKWRIEGLTSWNGMTKKFDYKSFRLTRDLHCWEASISYNDETGFRNDKGFSLDFRIKAFPSMDRFGIGQYGQPMDTSMGEYYY